MNGPVSVPLSLAAGIIGGLAGGCAMNMFARVVLALRGREARDASPGTDRTGRGMQPPQAAGRADDDAAIRAGTAVVEAVTGEESDPGRRRTAGVAAHYVFAAVSGGVYGMVATHVPAVRAAHGSMYGAVVWGLADEVVTPALGLARPRRTQSQGLQLYALAGHLVYACTLEFVFSALLSARGRSRDAGRAPAISVGA